MKIRVACFLIVSLACTIALAQNAPPPRGKAAINKLANIDYGRPALKGRSIDEMFKQLPADRIWRAGQNQVTLLTSERDLMVGNKKIPAGKYSVYVHVGQTGDWSLVLNKDLGVELIKIYPKAPPQMAQEKWPYYTDYTEKIASQEIARVPMKSEKLSAPVDLFTIDLVPNKNGGTLKMTWGDRAAAVDIAPAQ
jgi:hypothetical protein